MPLMPPAVDKHLLTQWFGTITVACAAIVTLALGWTLLSRVSDARYSPIDYRRRYEAETIDRDNLVRWIMKDVDERAAALEAHRNALSARHAPAVPPSDRPASGVGVQAALPNGQRAEGYADAQAITLLAADGTPQIVESARPSIGYGEVTRFYFNTQGRLMLAVRRHEHETDLNDRWYFLDGVYVGFDDRAEPLDVPPAGGIKTWYRFTPTGESDLRSLSEELRAALVRTGVDAKAAHIEIPASTANNWTHAQL